MENGQEKHEILQFRGSMFLSLVPVVIFFAFCALMFIGLKAFNMEALAMAGFIALLIGGVFCTSYTKYWNAAIKGISSVSSVSVIVIFFCNRNVFRLDESQQFVGRLRMACQFHRR